MGNSNIHIKKVTGNVVISQNQTGGVTAHEPTTNKSIPKRKKPFYKTFIFWVGVISSILTIFAYFGFQPKLKENKKPVSKISSVKSTETNKINSVKPTTLVNIIKHHKSHLIKKNMATNELKKPEDKSVSVSDVKGDVVISQNQSGGITAHTVNVNQEKQMTDADKLHLLRFIEDLKKKNNFNPTQFTISMVNNSNGNTIAHQIQKALEENGYKMMGNSFGYMMRYPTVNGIQIDKSRQGDYLEILVGNL